MENVNFYINITARLLIYSLVIAFSFFFHIPVLLLSFAILANVSLIVKTGKSIPILLMFLFFLTYVINLIPFFFNGNYIFAYPYTKGFYETLQIHALFLFSIDVFLLPIKKSLFVGEKIPYRTNLKGFLFVAFLFLFFIVFAIRGETILDTGGYGRQGDKTSLGGFGEYFLLLIPLLYIYGGKRVLLRKVTFILMLLMGIKLLLYGGRIGVLMMGLLVFMLYYNTKNRNISTLKLLLFSLPILYLFVLLGAIRANIFLVLESSWSEIALLPFKTNFLDTYIQFFGNQNDIFYSSTILNQAAISGTIGMGTRLEMFFYNVLSLVVPYSFLPEKAAVIPYIQANIASTGGGALVSSYFYFFLSYPGVILSGVFISFIINNLQRTKNLLFVLYAVIVLSTYPRWFGYNMISLFKISFYVIPVYLVVKFVFERIKIKTKNENHNR